MQNLHLLDHLFVVLVVIAFPLHSAWRIQDTLTLIRQGGERARVNVYRQIVLTWFVFAVVLLGLWAFLGRDVGEIGVRAVRAGTGLYGTLAALLYFLIMAATLRAVSRTDNPAKSLREQVGDLATLMPKTRREELWFGIVSLNAGITEELIFRGFLLWYLQQWVGGIWPAIVATLLFALAHAYQGVKQLPAIAFTAAVLVGFYLYTGSLLLPILLHIVMDAVQGSCFARWRRQYE